MANMYRQVDDKRIQLTDEEQKEYDNSQGFSEEEGLRLLRMQRNVLLTETDWMSFGPADGREKGGRAGGKGEGSTFGRR